MHDRIKEIGTHGVEPSRISRRAVAIFLDLVMTRPAAAGVRSPS
jgi:hypothetical protein